VNWYESVFELIDMRSFSNLWFWIALAVLWSTVSHWVLGVPWDMVMRGRRNPGSEADTDLRELVRINVNRIMFVATQSGLLLTGFVCFALTVLFVSGFFLGHEFAQAVFLLGMPVSLVGLLSISVARKLQAQIPEGDTLYRQLHRHRLITQVLGMLSIFVTSIWGMLQNMSASVLF